ncbi:MAG: hypothetical protein O9264_07825 [Leptospira sp.]|nr:hypothetical protein [Leptospira sp.]
MKRLIELEKKQEWMGMEDREELHQLMQSRLEQILVSLSQAQKTKKVTSPGLKAPSNREKADWNLSEIPILFGA